MYESEKFDSARSHLDNSSSALDFFLSFLPPFCSFLSVPSFLTMATRCCEYVFRGGRLCVHAAQLCDGQNRFCSTHHEAARSDASYNARVMAYRNDPEIAAAKVAYDASLRDARLEMNRLAEEARARHVPVEIPLQERTAVRIRGAPTWTADEKSTRTLCKEYGIVHRVSIHCDNAGANSGTATVVFATHEQAATALSRLNGAEHFGTTLETSWAITHTRPPAPPLVPWQYEYNPAVRAARRVLKAAQEAARERQEPGILAREQAAWEAERAEREAERAEEMREEAMRHEDDRAEQEMEARRAMAYRSRRYLRDEEDCDW